MVRQVRPSPTSAPATPAKTKSSGGLSSLFSGVEDPLLRVALQVSNHKTRTALPVPIRFLYLLSISQASLTLRKSEFCGSVDVLTNIMLSANSLYIQTCCIIRFSPHHAVSVGVVSVVNAGHFVLH